MQIKFLSKKIAQIFILSLFLLFLPTISKAGGTSYLFEITNLESKGNNQYKLTLKCKEKESECAKTNQIVIHLRFNKSALGKHMPSQITSENYSNCISKLKEQYKAGGSFRFGFMGTGIVPIRGKKNEYQSNALAELEEYDGKIAIYSFARPI